MPVLRHLSHALPVEPHLADAFDAREHVIDRLAADAHQLRSHDAGYEIAREIENFLRRRAFESFAKNRSHGTGECLHFRTERHANVCPAVFIDVQINAHRVCALLIFPYIDEFEVLALARLLFLRIVCIGHERLAPFILGKRLEEVDDLF